MAIELTEHDWPAKLLKVGQMEGLELPSTEWVWLQHGPAADPVTDLLVEVPADKAWSVRVIVEITETDA